MTDRKRILAIGIDPVLLEVGPDGCHSLELVRAYVASEIHRVRQAGFDVDECLLETEDDETEIVRRMKGRSYDCVLIGAGVRMPPNVLLRFERIINVVHELGPGARICFNTRPGDSLDAIRRWT